MMLNVSMFDKVEKRDSKKNRTKKQIQSISRKRTNNNKNKNNHKETIK